MRFRDVNDWVENLKNAIFRSRWYSELTDIDGEYLLRKLRSEAKEAI